MSLSIENQEPIVSPLESAQGSEGGGLPPIPANLDYGIIGNGSSCALVSSKGQIDWCCLPHFDSASVFASLLDSERGGAFGIEAVGPCEVTQKYVKNTNVLVTTYTAEAYKFEVIDFMGRGPKFGTSP